MSLRLLTAVLVCALLPAMLLPGCKDQRRRKWTVASMEPRPEPEPSPNPLEPGPFPHDAPWTYGSTPGGVPLWRSEGYDPTLLSELYREIDETAPNLAGTHPQIPASAVGPPPGWAVVVEPGFYYSAWPGGPNGYVRATGTTHYQDQIVRVVQRWNVQTQPLLPALAHEYAHAWSGDPCADHGGGCPFDQ